MRKFYSFTKKTILLFYLSIITYPSFSQETTGKIEEKDSKALFEKYFKEKDFKSASVHIPDMITAGILDKNTVEEVALCYMMLDEFGSCIDFCNEYIKNEPEAEQYLNDDIGYCHYCMEDYHNAASFLGKYLKNREAEEPSIDNYLLDSYSRSLYEIRQYKEAEKYFIELYDKIIKKENGTIKELYKYAEKYPYLDRSLYTCAYNYFLQGKINDGFTFLQNAAQSGYAPAEAELNILNESATFNKELVNLPKKIIKSYNECIEEFDVCKNVNTDKPNIFWDSLVSNNGPAQALYRELEGRESKKEYIPGTLQKALQELDRGKIPLEKFLLELQPYSPGEIESYINHNLFGEQDEPTEIRIYPDSFANAFATPWNQIYIATELIEKYNFNNALLLAVCAHEATHKTCIHSLVDLWEQEKKEKKNNIWAGIAVALNTAANVAAGACAASNGVDVGEDYWNSLNISNVSFIEAFEENTEMYKFKYNRNQEIEADINAYRFCETMGIGGYVMIMALELLGPSDGGFLSNRRDDHPTLSYRIGLLRYLYNIDHPIQTAD